MGKPGAGLPVSPGAGNFQLDSWRDYKDQTTPLSKTGIVQCDDIASLIDVLEEQPEAATANLPGQPFWF